MANSAFEVTGVSTVNGVILQVVSTTKIDTFSTNSSSYVDITGLSLNITPKSNSSTILLRFTCNLATNGNSNGGIQLVRNSTPICIPAAAGVRGLASSIGLRFLADSGYITSVTNEFLDAPATISPITYKLQLISPIGDTMYVNQTSTDANSPAWFRTVSTITAMEVSG